MTCCATLMRVFSVFSNFQLSITFSRGGPMLTRVVLPKEPLTLVKIRPTVSLVKISSSSSSCPKASSMGVVTHMGVNSSELWRSPNPPCRLWHVQIIEWYICENYFFPIKPVLSYFLSYHPHPRDQPECRRRLNGSESKTSSRQVCSDQSHRSEHCTKGYIKQKNVV